MSRLPSNRLPPVAIDLRQLGDEQHGYERLPDGRVFEPYNDRYPHVGPLYGDMIYPGHGYPPNPGEDRPGLSPFGRLARGQGLGKSSILLYNANDERMQPSAVQMLQLEGDDMDARQLCITLAPPRVIPLAYAEATDGRNVQNLTGEQLNGEVTTGNFPGDAAPIAWPPLEAIVEWGVRGASSRARVDYGNGRSLNVIASFVRVYAAVSQAASVGGFAGTSAAYYLSAFVGPGWNTTGTARNTVYVGEVDANSESDIIEIPPFATKAYLVGCDTSTSPPNITTGYIRFWQSPDGTNCVGNMFQSGNQPSAFEVPNGAQYFSVQSGMSVPTLFNVIFELSL